MGIDIRIVMIILLFLLAIPLARPLGLPIPITRNTMNFYDIVDDLEPGTKVLFNFIPTVSTMGDCLPPAVPVIYHLYQKQAKIYFVGIGVADGILNLIDTQVFNTIHPENFGYTYGEDWVNLGFVAGGDVSWAAFAENLRNAVKNDRYGNSIESLPIMQGINTLADFDLVISDGESVTQIVRQWGDPYKMPPLMISTTAAVPMDITPFYRTGQIKEYLGGLGAGAEYEALINRPGKATASLDAITATHLFMIFLIILGNIGFFLKKAEEGRSV